MNKYGFEEEEIDSNMLEGNLRNVTPQGNILKDRYKSMQKRNIIAPSRDLGLRKRNEVKRYVRKTHKDDPIRPIKMKKTKEIKL